MTYNPSARKTKAYSTIAFNLSYDDGYGLPSQSNHTISQEDINAIQYIVQNPEFLAPLTGQAAKATNIQPIVKEGKGVSISNDLKAFEYSIITTKEFAPYFERLIALKKLQGLDAGVVCIEDILKSPLVANGDTISNINDDAGKLRQYLNLAQSTIQYVLLAGTPPSIPMRYGKGGTYASDPIDLMIPTDLYFSEFKNNWNIDGNEYYGEYKSTFQYTSDIFVGRLICRTNNDIINYIDKVEQYELNPGNGDTSYLNHAYLYFSRDAKSLSLLGNKNEQDWICNPISKIHSNQQIRIETEEQWSGNEVMQHINQNHYGLIDLQCHGGPQGIIIGKNAWPYHGITGLDAEKGPYQTETGNGLDNLDNYLYPNYSYSMSCTTMPFDAPNIDFGIYGSGANSVSINFGESFTVGKHYGGVAFLGNTRFGYWSYSGYLESKFFEALGNTTLTHAEIGKSESFARSIAATPLLPPSQYGHYLRLTHNILGDPQIRIWKNVPLKTNISTSGLLRMSSFIEVRDSVSCTQPDAEYKVVARAPSGKIHIFPKTSTQTRLTGVSPHSIISIVGDNLITYPANMQLQNFRTSQSDYIYSNAAQIGRSIDPSLTTGDVVLEGYGMTYTIDATDFVSLNGGLIVRDFATLRVITPSFVILGDVTVSSGGKIEIYANGYVHTRDPNFMCDNAFFAYKYNKYNSDVKEPLEYGMSPVTPKIQRASNNSVIPMFEIGKEWRYQLHWESNPRAADQESLIRILRVDGTTELNGKTYYVVNSYTDGALIPDNNEPYGYFREEPENRKVYFMPNKNYTPAPVIYHNIYDFQAYDDEICLYDFNIEAATKRGYSAFTLPTTTMNLNGFTYTYKTDIAESYVEGIGYVATDSDGKPIPHEACDILGRPAKVDGTYGYLTWLYSVVDSKGVELFSINENRPTNILPTIPDNQTNDITIDYVGNSILIKSDREISTVDILNLQGFTISHHIVKEKQISIPVNMLPAGLYIVKAGLMTKTITVQ